MKKPSKRIKQLWARSGKDIPLRVFADQAYTIGSRDHRELAEQWLRNKGLR